MSTFTQWNGPQQLSPSIKDLTAFIDAYNNLSSELKAHVNATAPTDSKVHGIVDYVNNVQADLVNLIGTKATTQAVNELRTRVDAAATQSNLQAAVQMLNNLIAGKADSTALAGKADTTYTETLARNLQILKDDVDTLSIEWENFDKHCINSDTKLAFDCAIKSSVALIGRLKAYQTVDFTQWQLFNAPFAGTGSQDDTDTNGAFILGCLSLDWSDDPNAPAEANAHKASRAYIKYINSHPFDAIVDMIVTKTEDGYRGNLVAHVSKQEGSWEDMKFHLLKGTNNRNTESVYLAVSAKGLSKYGTDYTSMDFRACGYNFLPVGVEGFVVPTGLVSNITSVYIGESASGVTAIDALLLDNLWSNGYLDSDGDNFLSVERRKDPLTGQVYKTALVGDENFDDFVFVKRPMFIIDDGTTKALVPFITSEDIVQNTLPVPAIVRWPLVNPDGTLKDVPRGWHACDASRMSIVDYPDLEVLGPDDQGYVTLPNETHSIIRIEYPVKDISNAAPISKDLLELIYLNEKITKETVRANTAEQALAARIDETQGNVEAEVQRATATETQIASDLTNEITRAQAAEANLSTEISAVAASNIENHNDIIAENQRAVAAEQVLQHNIDDATATLQDSIDTVQQNLDDTATTLQGNIDTVQSNLDTATTTLQGGIDTVSHRIDMEQRRAEEVENQLRDRVAAETTRASEAEASLSTRIVNEETRAVTAETTLSNRIAEYEDFRQEVIEKVNEEIVRAMGVEAQLQTSIENETARAELAEQTLQTSINDETARATAKEQELQDAIDSETSRATAKEQELQDNINAEESRATAVEQNLATQFGSVEQFKAELLDAVSDEAQRAMDTEQAISDRIDALHPGR